MTDLIQQLRVTSKGVKEHTIVGDSTAPYAFLLHKDNQEAVLNLNCALIHTYHYIRDRFADNEASLGLVNAEKSTFIDLRQPQGFTLTQLESKQTYHLVKVISSSKSADATQTTEIKEQVSTMNMPDAVGQRKFTLEPLFKATNEDLVLLRNISSGKRRRSPNGEKNPRTKSKR